MSAETITTVGFIAQLATSCTLLVALVFGIIQTHHANQARKINAAFELLHTVQSEDWLKSYATVSDLSKNNGYKVSDLSNEELQAIRAVGVILETLGFAVYQKIVPIKVADEFMGGMIRIAWSNSKTFILDQQDKTGTKKTFEWFEWLADMVSRYPGNTTAKSNAFIIYERWKPNMFCSYKPRIPETT
jgi:hypothetical protein